MSESAFAASPVKRGKGVDEPDTCRICRGESSDGEELFYPCKCNGSIKFVHQSCLMEWLSHSQKKYCELCKTSFRFTKLYDPDMPQDLPAPVFLKELALHAARTLLTWLRFLLVAFVWLGWLPWSMRAVWRGLFWLADGRWPTAETIHTAISTQTSETLNSLAGTCPVPNVFAAVLPVCTTQSIQGAIPQLSFPASTLLNLTAGEPLIYSIAKRLLTNAVVLTTSTPSSTSLVDSGNLTASATRRLRQPSWLSDVDVLNRLTPYPTINNILIDTLEGQLITLLVVVLFIHVFLIREWVIQQQPAINLAEIEREAAIQLLRENRLEPVPEQNPLLAEPNLVLPAEIERVERVDETAGPVHPTDEPNGRPPTTGVPLPPEAALPGSRITSSGALAHRTGSPPEPDIPREAIYPEVPTHSPRPSFNDFAGHGWSFEPDGSDGAMLNEQSPPAHNLSDPLEEPAADTLNHTTPREVATASSIPSTEREAMNPGSIFSFDAGLADPLEGPSSGPSDHSQNIGSPLFNSYASDSAGYPTSPFASPVFGNSEHNLPGNSFDFRSSLELPTIDSHINAGTSHSVPTRDTHLDGTPDSGLARTPNNAAPTPPAEFQVPEAIPPAIPPQSFCQHIMDWFWGGIPLQAEQEVEEPVDEHVVEDPAQEPAFVPVRHGQPVLEPNPGHNRPAPVNDGAENDVDAADDADDLEGVMELIGMHGAIFGLLQNGVFSALLISFTVTLGIWLPYLWGKIALVLLTNPIRLFIGIPLAIMSIVADIAVDTIIGSFAYVVYVGNVLLRTLLGQAGKIIPVLAKFSASNAVTHASLGLIDGSGQRLRRILATFFTFRDSDVPMFSVLAHQALRIHQARITTIYNVLVQALKLILYDIPLQLIPHKENGSLVLRLFSVSPTRTYSMIVSGFSSFLRTGYSFFQNGSLSHLNTPGSHPLPANMDLDLAYWDTKDRIIAIIVGYCFASFVGLFYLRLSTYLSGDQRGHHMNGAVAEVLRQAGGVMKVILIIGIEMIVFPLYCGVLLDIALMPLFENATFGTRIGFGIESPFTCLFVHWFIGTCYMFHFALFVSMCRKIMRGGVLYFIRDPDDPTFHPVRDVLERNVSTQLRKIAFSALVYGALVIICMGGVVWGLAFVFPGVLPLHWSSNEPVLEFPVDLLFYNLVMPLTIRSIKPSNILHTMYAWWFHKCARLLRLTDFLFGKRKRDEEGYFANKTRLEMLLKAKFRTIYATDTKNTQDEEEVPVGLVQDGRFVRTPASDQVRIPKGARVFLDVNDQNERLDGKPDHDDGLHGKGNDMFTKVYVPPRFKTRIAGFIFLLWVFAAMTGVGATILPLVLGRKLISFLFPENTQINDIYAFSAGIYCLGGVLYGLHHCQQWAASLYRQSHLLNSPQEFLVKLHSALCQLINLLYAFTAFTFLVPTLFAIIVELYFLVPLHTYFSSGGTHVIHFVQDWTLGVLYTRMAARLMLRNETSRPAVALNAIVRNGWLRPDVKFATRAFIIPATLATFVAVFTPLPVGFILNATIFRGESTMMHSQVYRYCYPGFLLVVLLGWGLHLLQRQINVWRMSIRDDVYLIGERLHNFGEKRARDMGSARRIINTA
ncbi:hypothetical protein LOZ57_001790 [Ophidiomyces ophidiicola]|uniref:uncharacterized protein n=1 Tax=Ophidiomyces ophidiicola TaxID=1387563 RepID=UPI0020C2C53C|nr:uncharacterized protein LOZ57_001790 [Ophidiomyces ophidiicola]KAI1951235.1 hypothetical protein LOZ57_001790 [Ophidiomyces ophidiicola]KAI2060747.1 hypothetical protein LOZ43_001572 [Ophidiomyces ophidiicola]